MGERMSGGLTPGRRHAHPGGAVPGPRERDTAVLETVLADVLRGHGLDHEAEQRARAAFRAARDAGTHRARTRRRDDWRRPAERRAGRTAKMTFGVVFAGLTLGGVAVAAIGPAGSSADGAGAGRRASHPAAVAPARPGNVSPSASSHGLGPAYGSAHGRATEAHCRAYEQVKDRGKALGATAWAQLVAAAGGKDEVAAYCAEQTARVTAPPDRAGGKGRPASGNRTEENAATPGGTASRNDPGGSHKASGGKGGGKHP
ncbi:hypothetical protein [Streptomyces sp. NPDC046759]|uniref:hypothetical protein n=1 Tax=Streptomyces sp. NPDC046759 TaxID=3155019 RepID=UPI0033EA9EFF